MNIFDFAMQMEYDGKKFYEDLAENAPDEGVKNIFQMLARDEEKHYKAVEEMSKKEYSMADTDVLPGAKNIFSAMQERKHTIDLSSAQEELYRKAQEMEKKSRDFYNEKAEEVEKEYQKDLFLRMAKEEQKHYNLLQNIIDLVRRPQMWLENAEWTHLEDY